MRTTQHIQQSYLTSLAKNGKSVFYPDITEHYTKSDLLRKKFFTLLSISLMTGALIWTAICMLAKVYLAGLVPFTFILFTILNLCCRWDKNQDHVSYNIQVGMSLILPFGFQILLGGLEASGIVMLWSLVSLMGALTFERRNIIYLWFGLYIALIVVSILIEPYSRLFVTEKVAQYSGILVGINVSAISFILFMLSRYFIVQQSVLRKKLKIQNELVVKSYDLNKLKTNEINESLEYAKRLQESILPTQEKLHYAFNDNFIFFKPKDVVSGDFYWYASLGDWKITSVIDCTGHGVPGAMLSIMSYNLLNDIVLDKKVHEPELIMSELRNGIVRRLRQKSNGNRDGMDLSIIAINEARKQIKFCGAKSNMIVVDPMSKITLIKGSRNSIGGVDINLNKKFRQELIEYQKETAIYLYTDGITDQFGGALDKKLGQKRFLEWIEELQGTKMTQQLPMLENKWSEWKGDKNQTDDALVAGFWLD